MTAIRVMAFVKFGLFLFLTDVLGVMDGIRSDSEDVHSFRAMYFEQPCCTRSRHVRHHKAWIRTAFDDDFKFLESDPSVLRPNDDQNENPNEHQIENQNEHRMEILANELSSNTNTSHNLTNNRDWNFVNSDTEAANIVKRYAQTKELTDAQRNLFVRRIICHEFHHNSSGFIRPDRLDELGTFIQQIFPTENKATYYTPYVNEGNKKINQSGKLYAAYRYIRDKNKNSNKNEKKPSEQTSTSTTEVPEPELIEVKINFLRTSVVPLEKINKYWEDTFLFRQNLLKQLKLNDYVKHFDILRFQAAKELYRSDFNKLYPAVNFLSTWESVCSKLIPICQKKLKNDKSSRKTLLLELYKESLSKDQIDVIVLYLLPRLIKPIFLKNRRKPSSKECEEAFIIHVENVADKNEVILQRREYYRQKGLTFQPTPVFIGPLPDVQLCYVVFDDQFLQVERPIEAIELCFSMFFALNAEYPEEAKLIWQFLQNAVCGIRLKSDKQSVTLNTLIGELGDHVREFSCGKLYYRTFHLDERGDNLYVGAMDRVFRLNLSNISHSNCEHDSLNLEQTSGVINCISKGKSENFDCHNHIRVIQPIGDGSRLYICGTNAHNPKDWVIYSNLTMLPRHEYVPGIGPGLGKCPFDPNDNSTAVWAEKGNPGDLPALYSGTIADFTKADTVIFRGDLYNLTTGRVDYSFKRTLKYDSKWLDKPDFVGSYDVGQYVFFFFRETAVEYINCGKSVYSRVARICKKDTGGKHILNQNWATYLKARLNCSIPGEFPFYFNEIQSVYKVDGDDNKFYGVFTTSTTGLMGSAICTFTLEDIEKAFNGKFKEQATSSSAWLPVLSNKVPEPRPGQCVNDTETLPDSVLNFIRSHPLMDEAVAHKDNKPVFYKRDLLFTRLVVDPLQYDVFGSRYHYTVFYAGTNLGYVYKVVQWHDEEGQSHSSLLDIYEVTQGLPIRVMEISREHKSLYVASDEKVHQIDIVMCNHRYDSCLRCVRDPYCGWDKDNGICKPYQAGLLQDVGNTSRSICDNFAGHDKFSATYGQSVHLTCFVKMPEVLRSYPITWYHYNKENTKSTISYSNDKYVSTSEGGVVVLEVSESDAGRYECWLAGSTLCVYHVNVETHRCSPPGKSVDYHKVYSDWCHEFQKYKNAMKSWERKKEQCARQNDSSIANQNLHTNEIIPRNFR